MPAVRTDQQLVYYDRFHKKLSLHVKDLITDELIEAYRRSPDGPHGDALMRVLVHFGSRYKYALYSPVPLREFVIVSLPTAPGEFPQRVDGRVFHNEKEARYAMFLLNVADLRQGAA
jgi:hypothetical protein